MSDLTSKLQTNKDTNINNGNNFQNKPKGENKFQNLNTQNWAEKWFGEGNHRYNYRSPDICEIQKKNCTINNLVKIMNKMSAYPHQKHEFLSGEKHIGNVDIPGPWGVDNVTSTAIYDSKGNQKGIRNQTLENHALHNGVVERTIEKSNNKLHIQTKGGGYGDYGKLNVFLSETVWAPVDQKLIDTFNELKNNK